MAGSQGQEEAVPIAQAMCEGQKQKEVPADASLFALVRHSKMTEALELLARSPHLWGEVDEEGHSLLHWGALSGSLPFMREALDPKNGAGLADKSSPNGQTPFMWATINGHIALMRMLLQAGANVRAKDSFGATALALAVQHDKPGAILLLMSRGPREKMMADADTNGCTALHWAAYKGNLNILKLLDYFEADFNVLDNDSKTVLHRAVQASQVCVFEFLIEKEVDPSKRDKDNNTCMDIAEKQKDGYLQRALARFVEVEGGGVPSTPQVGNVIVDGDNDEEACRGNLKKKKKQKDEMKDLKMKALQNAAPTFWLVCVSLALFQFLTDLRATSMLVCPVTAMLFQLGVPLSMALFFYVANGDPGKIPSRIKHASGVEELMRKIDADGSDADAAREVKRLCTTTWILKGPRTKYCKHTGACVEEFDHFCGWLNCAIGKGNHRPFIFLALAEVATQCCHWWICVQVVLELIKFESTASWTSQVLTGYPITAFVIALHTLTAPGIMMLLLHQLRLVAVNLTTNEMINAYKYEHFWLIRDTGKKVFRNPFNKGGVVGNCLDFWWIRRRADLGPADGASACASKGCCNDQAPKTKIGREHDGIELV